MQQVHLPKGFAAMVEAMLPVLQKVPDESSNQHGEQAAATPAATTGMNALTTKMLMKP
jgi:hypothetical protein